jgi:hypothetical protein
MSPMREELQMMFPKTVRYCKICQSNTTHEVRANSGVVAKICVECLDRALRYELDRD